MVIYSMSRAAYLIHEALGRKRLDLPYAIAKGERDVHFETGKSVEFPYVHNKEPTPDMGKAYGQHLEPSGKYMIHTGHRGNLPNREYGTHRFDNPLVIEWGTTTAEPHGWKYKLSKAFGGKTGKGLSKAIRKHGHDGVVTVQRYKGVPEVSEIISLTHL